MFDRQTGLVIALAGVVMMATAFAARAYDESKYPAFEGQWRRGSPVGVWDPTKPVGRGQQAPLTPEYQAIYEATEVARAAGRDFDPKANCMPPGMPRVMTMYEPMEISIKPNVTYFMIESQSPLRRIFTDGRDWPKDIDPSFAGYSIGKWLDQDGDGRYDALEIETRFMKGTRIVESTGIPLHRDGETVVKEKLYLDQKDPDILVNEITTIDHAFTRPWSVTRQYRRVPNPIWAEYNCGEDNRYVVVGGEIYMIGIDGFLMPLMKGQPAPDLRYFESKGK
jgi:hypothetical protein